MAREQPKPPSRRPHVVFVCTGNTCRSPMAEALLRARVRSAPGCRVSSAGIAAMEGAPASTGSLAVLREIGLDLSSHRSRPLTRKVVDEADLLVPLSLTHYAAILASFPDARERTLLLGSFLDPDSPAPNDFADPIGGSDADYRATRDAISRAVDALATFLAEW